MNCICINNLALHCATLSSNKAALSPAAAETVSTAEEPSDGHWDMDADYKRGDVVVHGQSAMHR